MARPSASSLNALHTMQANRRISGLEVRFRSELWRAGARGYRLHARLPGRPDITFPRLKLAIFVQGCFWHRCPVCELPMPKANAEFWADKLATTMRRDEAQHSALHELGWTVMTIWEHELRRDLVRVAARVAADVLCRRQNA